VAGSESASTRPSNRAVDGLVAEDGQTTAENFRAYLCPDIGGRRAASVTAVQLDRLYS
jgi:hypothetical protein